MYLFQGRLRRCLFAFVPCYSIRHSFLLRCSLQICLGCELGAFGRTNAGLLKSNIRRCFMGLPPSDCPAPPRILYLVMSTTLVLNTAVVIHPVPHRIVGGEPQTLAAQHCILKQHQKYVQSRVDVLDGGADGMNRDGDLDFAHGTVPRVRAVFTTLLSSRCQSFEILAPRAVTQRGQIDIMIVASPLHDACQACV